MKISREDDNLVSPIGKVAGAEVGHWSFQTSSNDVIVGATMEYYRNDNGDKDFFVFLLHYKDINNLGAPAMVTPAYGAKEGTLRYQGKFFAPAHHVIVGMECLKFRKDDGDVDTYRMRFKYAPLAALNQRHWGGWFGPQIGNPEHSPTPMAQEVPSGAVAVGFDFWRYREDHGDYDSYAFGLRYGKVVP